MVGEAWRSGPQAGKEWPVPRTTDLAGMDPRREKSPPRPTTREHQPSLPLTLWMLRPSNNSQRRNRSTRAMSMAARSITTHAGYKGSRDQLSDGYGAVEW